MWTGFFPDVYTTLPTLDLPSRHPLNYKHTTLVYYLHERGQIGPREGHWFIYARTCSCNSTSAVGWKSNRASAFWVGIMAAGGRLDAGCHRSPAKVLITWLVYFTAAAVAHALVYEGVESRDHNRVYRSHLVMHGCNNLWANDNGYILSNCARKRHSAKS